MKLLLPAFLMALSVLPVVGPTAAAAQTGKVITIERAAFGRAGAQNCDAISALDARCRHKIYCQFPVTTKLCPDDGTGGIRTGLLTVNYACDGHNDKTATTQVGQVMTLSCR